MHVHDAGIRRDTLSPYSFMVFEFRFWGTRQVTTCRSHVTFRDLGDDTRHRCTTHLYCTKVDKFDKTPKRGDFRFARTLGNANRRVFFWKPRVESRVIEIRARRVFKEMRTRNVSVFKSESFYTKLERVYLIIVFIRRYVEYLIR